MLQGQPHASCRSSIRVIVQCVHVGMCQFSLFSFPGQGYPSASGSPEHGYAKLEEGPLVSLRNKSARVAQVTALRQL